MSSRPDPPSSLDAFEPIRSASQCHFASSSTLVGCPLPSADASTAEIVELLLPALATLCAQRPPFAIEGVVIQLTDPTRGDTLAHLARTVREVLFGIGERDPDARTSLRESIGAPDWWFRFSGVELLLVTFAQCYDAAHPRCSFSSSTFLLFQPHAVFARRRPQGSERFPIDTKQAIRRAFEQAGRRYDERLSGSAVESLKFVKPLAIGDAPVEWWLMER